jgi:hypothetical protein
MLGGSIESSMSEASNAIAENTAEIDVIENASEAAGENAIDAVENVSDTSLGGVLDASGNVADSIVPLPTDSRLGDSAEKGLGAFVEPDEMEVDNWYTLEFVAAPDEPGLADESEDLELTPAKAIYVAPIMRVTLLDEPSFEIRSKTDAIQLTGRNKAASWQWNVKPLTGGERSLYAKVEVLRRHPSGEYEATESRTRRVAVTVKVGTWQGFLTALRNASTLGDVLSTLFAAWKKTLVALALLIGAASGVWLAIKNWGKPKD